MSVPRAAIPGARRQPRGVPACALLAACTLLAAVLAGCGEATPGNGPVGAAKANASAGAPDVAANAPGTPAGTDGANSTSATRPHVEEVTDPEEANSFPAPASVHHAAASTPARAGEVAVAAGAQSDAEIRRELQQMHAAEQQAAKPNAEQALKPVPGGESIGGNGTLPIPTGVPDVIQKVVAGANAITDFPYVFGGGHASFVDDAYDCSGSVSYALAAGGLLSAPETSGELESWGAPGPGRYITVYANAGHTYMYVDGILYDTAGRSGVYASRWQVGAVDNSGYVARHWPGL
jgi:cell wall-associated NlpC family hydrolase